MNRKEFIKMCGLLGLSIPFQTVLSSCSKDDNEPVNNNDSIIIIGAGVAGMTAAYLLAQKGINFQIIEASSTYGGRIKRTTSFVDFPIPLGAEWLHTSATELSTIVNNSSIQINTQLQGYQSQDQVGYFENGSLTLSPIFTEFGSDFEDKKFINSSWLDFFEEYIVPSISSKMIFNKQITSINYSGSKVILTDNAGQNYESDKVIVTVPLKILQEGVISFTPTLPTSHTSSIQNAPIWGGIKVFIEFSSKFYPSYLTFPDSETNTGQRVYYDASHGQNSSANVLGLVALGTQAEQYQNLSGNALKIYILDELDAVFGGLATTNYIKHIVQDWSNEPFIKAAYLADIADSEISENLSISVANKLFFAGDAYTKEDDWGGVHNASRSARDVINEIT
ncbi:MAG: FAD-dependent oxidoreductase [Fulvivirga sp.]